VGNQRAKKEGPKRKVLSYRIREDLIERAEARAGKEGVKPREIIEEILDKYL
jgi:predicted DNA binding CopG/RHH family protein